MIGAPGAVEKPVMAVPCAECGEGVLIGEWMLEIVALCHGICDRQGWPRQTKGEVVLCDLCTRRWRLEMDRQSGEASLILRDLRAVVMNGGSPMAIIDKAPAWFRRLYGEQVTEIIQSGPSYSNREQP